MQPGFLVIRRVEPLRGGLKPDIKKPTHDPASPCRLLITKSLLADGKNRISRELLTRLARGIKKCSELFASANDGIRCIGGAFLRCDGTATQRELKGPRCIPAEPGLCAEKLDAEKSGGTKACANFNANAGITWRTHPLWRSQNSLHGWQLGKTITISADDISRLVVRTAGIA